MLPVVESIFGILKGIPYGEGAIAFLKSMPADIFIIGLILGFFATAASWGNPNDKYEGLRALLEKIYKVSGVVCGILCIVLGGYILVVKTINIFFYLCGLLLGAVFEHIVHFLFSAFGRPGHYLNLLFGSLAGAVSLVAGWLYYKGILLQYLK